MRQDREHDKAVPGRYQARRPARGKGISTMNPLHMLCHWMCSLMGGCPMMGQPM